MSVRNNQDRTGARQSADAPATIEEEDKALPNPMSFVIPTEMVELPSKGQGYPPEHPLFNQEMVEIRHMTAKDEDILTSRSLLKKGIALDRLIDNILVNKKVRSMHLLSGDRSAIVIEARKYAYGNEYKTKLTCPACGEQKRYKYDLNDKEIHYGEIPEDVETNENGNFVVTLPVSKFKIEIKRMTGKDEQDMIVNIKKNSKGNNGVDTNLSEQLKAIMVSVNGDTRRATCNYFAENMLSSDTRVLREMYRKVNPDVKLNFDFECRACGHEQVLEVALDADFFWPDR
tara:strand:+ start:2758 stop:3618 length:861 start_codon:yes stop_codon:yes gene_type:complete